MNLSASVLVPSAAINRADYFQTAKIRAGSPNANLNLYSPKIGFEWSLMNNSIYAPK